MSTADVVHAPEHFPDIDLVACQHTILRDTQHLLRPWNDDALAMESEGASDAASPAHLLQQTAQGTVSGLCFIEAVESTDAERPVRHFHIVTLSIPSAGFKYAIHIGTQKFWYLKF